jgi:osmotically-inducible protein OsmY
MKHTLNVAAAFAAGAIAMYYFDATLGRRRRALVRDKAIGLTHDAADVAQARGKRFIDRARGFVATGRLDRQGPAEPQSDAQLRERVRSRLGHWVSHPRAIEVDVEGGVVRVSGQVLAKELDGLLSRLTGIPGVHKVHNALVTLDDPSGFGEAQSPKRSESVAH